MRDVEDTDHPNIRALGLDDFERQLDWIEEHYRVATFEEFERVVVRGRQKPNGKPLALLTFDDGFVDHHDAAYPILKRRGMSGVFFATDPTLEGSPQLLNVHKTHFLLSRLGPEALAGLVSGALEASTPGDPDRPGVYRYDVRGDADIKRVLNYEVPFEVADALLDDLFASELGDTGDFATALYLSADMVSSMATDGMTFGGHTASHRVLSRLAPDLQRRELVRGVSLVRSTTGQRNVPFCYPYGHKHTYNQTTLDLIATLGYSCAFNTVRRSARIGGEGVMEVPRFDTKDLWPFGPEAPPTD